MRLTALMIIALATATGLPGPAAACHNWFHGCDPEPEPEPCEGKGDMDGDGICDDVDPDRDGDGWENRCDPREYDPETIGDDFDEDGRCDKLDNDDDNDGVPDACDPHPQSRDDIGNQIDYVVAKVKMCDSSITSDLPELLV